MHKTGAIVAGWALVAAYMLAIYALSAQGPIDALDFLGRTGLDKAAHAIEFGILAMLMLRALGASGLRRGGLAACVAAVAASGLYAVFDERHQLAVPGRVSDAGDLAADFAGIALAAGAWLAFARRLPGIFLLRKSDADTPGQ